jgi:glycosyltransferase involved in cell wall biosynthesis
VWNVRQSNLSRRLNSRSTLIAARLTATVSGWLPAAIVLNAEASVLPHIRLGYPANKLVVIPNGFEIDRFHPDRFVGYTVRGELGIADDAFVVMMVGRFDPQKDHKTFILASAEIARAVPGAEFVLCGAGIDSRNEVLAGWLRDADLEERTHLLGCRHDVERLLQAADVVVQSSVGEGFPNALGEAMACGVPVVATDVGDTRLLVDDAGRLVPSCRPDLLSESVIEVAQLSPPDRLRAGDKGRKRIAAHFSMSTVAERYVALWYSVARIPRPPGGPSFESVRAGASPV